MREFKIVSEDEEFRHQNFSFFGVARHTETLEKVNIYAEINFPKFCSLGRYRHFKGKEYLLLGLAWFHGTKEELVIYQALYDSDEFGKNALWVRPSNSFLGIVVGIDGSFVQRFSFLGF